MSTAERPGGAEQAPCGCLHPRAAGCDHDDVADSVPSEDGREGLFADVPEPMWRGLAETLIKGTRWDEWQRHGWRWQGDRITELAEELRRWLPDAELVKRRIMPALAAREQAAAARAKAETLGRIDEIVREWQRTRMSDAEAMASIALIARTGGEA